MNDTTNPQMPFKRWKVVTAAIVILVIAIGIASLVYVATGPERRAVEEAQENVRLAQEEADQALNELEQTMKIMNRMN